MDANIPPQAWESVEKDDEQLPLTAALPALEQVSVLVRLAEAADLARGGSYAQAEMLLKGSAGWETSPEALDLLARCAAQQGNTTEARQFWQQAIGLDPTNPAYAEGLVYLTRTPLELIMGRLPWLKIVRWVVALAFLFLLLFGSLRLARLQTNVAALSKQAGIVTLPAAAAPTADLSTLAQKSDLQALGSKLDALQADQKQTGGSLATLQSNQQTLSDQLKPTVTAPEVKLNLAGITTHKDGARLIVQFDEGLFLYEWVLKPTAASLLTSLGQQLEPYAGQIKISLVGYRSDQETDVYFDLNLMRAVIVFDRLTQTTQLPKEIFSLLPRSDVPFLFPNDTPENRLKNQTVILIIENK
jgi:hypothetical protein